MDEDRKYSFMGKTFQELLAKKDKQLYRRIFMVTFPAFLELLFTSLFGAVDTAMVGQLGPSELAGVGLTGQPFYVLIAIFAAVNTGVTTMVSWAKGQDQELRIGNIIKQAVVFNIITGSLLTLAGIVFAPQVINFVGRGKKEMVVYGVIYMRAISYGVLFQAITMSLTAALRGVGETKIPMFYNMFSNLLNIFLNWILIYGNLGFKARGVLGAGLATTISRFIAMLLALYVVFISNKSPFIIKLRGNWKLNFKTLGEILKIGLPTAGESLVIQSALMVFTRQIAGLGTIAYAAHQIAMEVNRIVLSISSAFQISTTSLVGQALGANNKMLAKKYVDINKRFAQLTSTLAALILIALGRPISMLFTSSKDVIVIAQRLFIFIAAIKFFQSVRMTLTGALRGGGDTLAPLLISLFGTWFLRISLTWLLAYKLSYGLYGAWIAFLLDQFSRYVFTRLRYNKGKWQNISLE